MPPVTGVVGSTPDSNTLLLVHADGTAGSTTFTDSSSYARTLTASGGSQVNTSAPKFGSGAVDFSANNSNYINVGNSIDFNFGANQFTIEAWGYFTSYNSSNADIIFAQWGSSGSLNFIFGFNAGAFICYYSTDGTSQINTLSVAFTPTTNTWYHFAIDRDAGGTARLYINGAVMLAQAMPALAMVGGTPAYIGNNPGYLFQAFHGYLDEVRVSNIARYGGAFTPPSAPFPSLPPFDINTELLVHADGTNGSTSFIDSSLYPHTLTASNGAQVTTAATKFGSGAANFTTATSIIDTGNASGFRLGVGQYTIEAWAYFTSAPGSAYNTIVGQWGIDYSWWFGTDNAGNLILLGSRDGSGSFFSTTAAFTPTLNTWYHLAVDRDASNVTRLYVNGSVITTDVTLNSFYTVASATVAIGNQTNGGTTNFLGYLDEVRVSIGIARYAGAFTPPTAPFSVDALPLVQAAQTLSATGVVIPPPATGGVGGNPAGTPFPVTLLVHADGTAGSTTFVDNGPLGLALTSTGGAVISSTSKFGTGGIDVSAANAGVDAGTQNALDFSSDPFTIDIWAYFTEIPTLPHAFEQFTLIGSDYWRLFTVFDSDHVIYLRWNSYYGGDLSIAYTPPLNTWTHFAVDRDASGLTRLYVNGTVLASYTDTSSIPNGNVVVGNNGSHTGGAIQGYLDEAAICCGVARYQGAFTPPTQPYISVPTVLLVHADGTAGSTSFTDSSLANNTLTAHSTTVTATSKFGSGAMNFTASSAAYIDTGANGIFHISTNPFTVEAWAYFTSVPGADAIIAAKWFYGSSDFSTAWRFGYVSGSLAFQYSNTGYDNFNLTYTWTPPLNAWHHVAVDRDASNTIRLYLDGVVVATTSSSVNIIEGGHPTFIGNDGALASGFTGYLDEVRVSRFKALYAGAFTPPSAPFDPYPTTGPLAQNAQTLSATGTVGAASSTGTLVVTQASQTLVATAVVTVGATLGVTQAAQTLAATGWSAAFGPIAATQAPHTLVALGVDVLGGTLVVTQAPQTLAAAGSPRVGGTLGITQASQTLTAVGSPSVGGTLGVTQATQTLAAAGWRAATGTLAVTQAPQTLAGLGSAVTGTSGSLIVTQAPQTLSASATLGGVTGALGLTQAPQTLLGIGTVIPVVSGTLTLTQAPQILAGIGAVTPTISGTLNLTQEEQILVATAVVFTPSAVTTQARVLVMA